VIGTILATMRFANRKPLRCADYAGVAVLTAIFLYGVLITPMPFH
jgi:hypothetical protein